MRPYGRALAWLRRSASLALIGDKTTDGICPSGALEP